MKEEGIALGTTTQEHANTTQEETEGKGAGKADEDKSRECHTLNKVAGV